MRFTEEKCFAVLISVWKTCNTKTSTNVKCHQMSKTTFLGGDPCTQHSHHNCWKGEPWSRIKGMSNDLEICIPEINKPRCYQAAEENSQDDKECVDMVALRMPFCLQIRFEYCSGTLALPSKAPKKYQDQQKGNPCFSRQWRWSWEFPHIGVYKPPLGRQIFEWLRYQSCRFERVGWYKRMHLRQPGPLQHLRSRYHRMSVMIQK